MEEDKKSEYYATWRMIYAEADEDIRFFKRQKWQVTNYLLLLFVALIGAISLVKDSLPDYSVVIIFLFILSAGLAGIYIICDLEKSIFRARERTDRSKEALAEIVPYINEKHLTEGSEMSIKNILISIQVISIVAVMFIAAIKILT